MDKTFEKWCEKLLDTGRRNNLINFKETLSSTLDILSPDADEIFKRVSGGEKLSFYDVDDFVEKTLKQKSGSLTDENQNYLSKQEVFDKLSGHLSKREILSYKLNIRNKKIIENLKRNAKVSIDERGVNILYISFGMLIWHEPDCSKNINCSPLVLLPIAIDETDNKFYISEYEDEFSTNPTLVYKLKTEFHITLPEIRETGFEDETLFEYFKRVQSFNKDWEVRTGVKISTFSFLKLDMYKDLVENEENLLKNEMVLKLLNKDSAFQNSEESEQNLNEQSHKREEQFAVQMNYDNLANNFQYEKSNSSETSDNEKLDLKNIEIRLHNVVDADSSQMMAILRAKNGESFVLQGPPGTGKSQTITNLIAEFLADDKKVLFVSEKLAALSVVYNNLKKVGLSDFCLELHSNKSNKKNVIEELNRMLSFSKKIVSANAEAEHQELIKYKTILDDFVKQYHKIYPEAKKSAYEVLELMTDNENDYNINFEFENVLEKDDLFVSKCLEYLEIYTSYANEIGYDYHKNPWYGFSEKNISSREKFELKEDLKNIELFVKLFSQELLKISKNLKIEFKNFNDFENNLEFLKAISNLDVFNNDLFKKEELEKLCEKISELDSNLKEENLKRTSILNFYKKEIFELDIQNLLYNFNHKYSSIFRIFSKEYKKNKEILFNLQISKDAKLNYEQTRNWLKLIDEYFKLKKDNTEKLIEISAYLKNDNLNFSQVEKIKDSLENLNKNLKEDFEPFEEIDQEDFFNLKNEILHILEYQIDAKRCKNCLEKTQNLFDERKICFKNMNFNEILQKIYLYQSNYYMIETWIRFYANFENLKELGLNSFIDLLIENNVNIEDYKRVFLNLFYKEQFFEMIDSSETLSNFTRLTQDLAVHKFKLKDKLNFEISKAKIISSLSMKLPSISGAVAGTEINVLSREANKKRRQKPVRVLFKEIFPLIQRLKPCLLMSPLSVCSYLDYETCKFDVVIFDEASQIFPWDAIGAISRAKQVIIVGDSKQMPPTDFFSSNTIEESEENAEESDSLDFESILDLGSAILPSQRLNWHYRSKTEELIAFSNENYYDSSLVTFPSAYGNRKDMGVDFYYQEDGIFDRKRRVNENEAKKVVELVFDHFKNHPERSLGVVAFSVAQQEIIQDKIQEYRLNNKQFEKFFDDRLKEPFFVKNLETVQGDERDTIIFSIAYAKDEEGRFLHNFGPLNKVGGERRLNVAVTRAKYNVKVVSSIRSNDIDLSRSNARGTYLLKKYLELAEFGTSRKSNFDEQKQDTSGVEKQVAEFLKANGFIIETNVGFSEYKIDIAVKNKNNDYALAIEFDGNYYKNLKTTRDRDRLRQEVLEKLNWKFYRIWTIDWFLNNEIEKKKLLEVVEDSVGVLDDASEKTANFQQNNENIVKNEQNNQNNVKLDEENSGFIIETNVVANDLKSYFSEYEEFDLSNFSGTLDQAIFNLVKTEAPITEKLLLKKIAPFIGREKVTSVVKDVVDDSIKRQSEKIFKIEDFYVLDKNMNVSLRIAGENKQRDISLISNVELASGLYIIIKNNCGITEKGLFLTISNLLGFSKLGTAIEEKLSDSIKILLDRNMIEKIDDEYFLKD